MATRRKKICSGFKGMMLEVKEKLDTLDSKEPFKPTAERQSTSCFLKIHKFKESHPGMDVSPCHLSPCLPTSSRRSRPS